MTKPIAFVGATVIDGTGRPPRPNTTVVVHGERISAVVADGIAPSGATVVDLTGRWLLPGFIEAHCHVGGLVDPADPERGLAGSVLPALLRYGITTVRDTGSPDIDQTFPVLLGDRPDWPRFFGAGPAIDGVPGGPFPGLWRATEPADARQFVRIIVGAGAAFIKAYAWLPRDILVAVIDEAHALGVPVTGHVGHAVSSVDAVRCGIDALEHVRIGAEAMTDAARAQFSQLRRRPTDAIADHRSWRYIDPNGPELARTIDALASHGVTVTPTLSMTQNVLGLPSLTRDLLSGDPELAAAMEQLPGEGLSEGYDPADRAHSEREFDGMLAFVGKAHAAGVSIAVGTDSPSAGGVVPGLAFHNELELLVRAGMSPLAVLSAATSGGAQLLRRSADFGTISGGRYADVVVVDRDPIADIRNTLRISAVLRSGVVCHDKIGIA